MRKEVEGAHITANFTKGVTKYLENSTVVGLALYKNHILQKLNVVYIIRLHTKNENVS